MFLISIQSILSDFTSGVEFHTRDKTLIGTVNDHCHRSNHHTKVVTHFYNIHHLWHTNIRDLEIDRLVVYLTRSLEPMVFDDLHDTGILCVTMGHIDNHTNLKHAEKI